MSQLEIFLIATAPGFAILIIGWGMALFHTRASRRSKPHD